MELGTVASSRPSNETPMMIIKVPEALTVQLETLRKKGQTVGFVPTMGALHQGHLSLIEASVRNTDLTVCSIFVNPTQFNDPADFQKYPVTLEKDIEMLESAGTDILFLPSVAAIYPSGTNHLRNYDLGQLEHILEGKYRPGHFQGVCQVMHRLLDIVQADRLYMGSKDYQQCMVVERLIQLTGSATLLEALPTLREPGGLAMSSRNMRLSGEQRERATTIFRALTYIKDNLLPGDLASLRQTVREMLEKEQFRVDYVEIADALTLETAGKWDGNTRLTALVAAFLGEVRLIDNMEVSG